MHQVQHLAWGSIKINIRDISLFDKAFICVSLAAILLFTFPQLSLAHTIDNQPLLFEINDFAEGRGLNPVVQEDYFAKVLAKNLPVKFADPRIKILEEYLRSRKSPWVDYADAILEQSNYRFILGIGFAESNFCRHQIRQHNCWGIGGTNPETYPDYPAGIARANELIQKYPLFIGRIIFIQEFLLKIYFFFFKELFTK